MPMKSVLRCKRSMASHRLPLNVVVTSSTSQVRKMYPISSGSFSTARLPCGGRLARMTNGFSPPSRGRGHVARGITDLLWPSLDARMDSVAWKCTSQAMNFWKLLRASERSLSNPVLQEATVGILNLLIRDLY